MTPTNYLLASAVFWPKYASQHSVFACLKKACRSHIGLLSRVLIVGLVLMLCACSQKINLQIGLNDEDANEIITLLYRHGITAQKRVTKEGVALMVDDTDIARATDAMTSAGLPRKHLSDLGQVFKKEGMISTPLEERVRYIHGLSQELESTLQQIDQVVGARVHVVLPERVAPGEPIQPSSAAVFIKHRLPFDEDAIVPRIRHLVASSIPGLSGEDGISKVSVILSSSEIRIAPIEWSQVGPFRVQTESANQLYFTLAAMSLAVVLSLLSTLFMYLMRYPKFEKFVQKHFSRFLPTKLRPVVKRF